MEPPLKKQKLSNPRVANGPLSIVWSFGSTLDRVRWNPVNKYFRRLYVNEKRSLATLELMWPKAVIRVNRFLSTLSEPRTGTVDLCYICMRVTVYKARCPCAVCVTTLEWVFS